MASAAAARGPMGLLLQNTSGQYLVLGLGFYTLFPEKFAQLSSVLKLVATNDLLKLTNDNSKSGGSTGPIIIHTPPPTVVGGGGGGGQRTWVGTIVSVAVGTGACWAGYMVAVQVLPDAVNQLLPVSRSIFDKTSQSLGKGILTCKQVLEEKVAYLTGETEKVSKKQDETNKTVSHIKSELGEARMDLTMMQSIMKSCEGSLGKSEGMQQYTLRGVRLLVRCVANMMPNDIETVDELARFIEEEQNMLIQNRTSSESENILARPTTSPGDIPIAKNVVVRATSAPSTVTTATSTVTSTPITSTPIERRRPSNITATTVSPMRSLSQSFNKAAVEEDKTFTDIRSLLGH